MLKQFKIITLAPTCFGSRWNRHQGAVLCLAKTTNMGFLILRCVIPVVLSNNNNKLMVHMYIVTNTTIFLIVRLLLTFRSRNFTFKFEHIL